MICTSSSFYCKLCKCTNETQQWKLECYKRKERKTRWREEKRVTWHFFFRAVNNTFLQISQQRKHKCKREIGRERDRKRERETTARETEREKIKTRMGTGPRVHPPGDFPKLHVIGYSILISYIDTYPLCDNKPCPVILYVVSCTHPSSSPCCPESDWSKISWRKPLIFLKGADVDHINLKPKSHLFGCQ